MMENNTFFQCQLYNQRIQSEQMVLHPALAQKHIAVMMLHLSFQDAKTVYRSPFGYLMHIDMEGEITISELQTEQKIFDSKSTNTEYVLLSYIMGDDGERLFYIDSSKNNLLRFALPIDLRRHENTMDMQFSNVYPVYQIIENLLGKLYHQNWYIMPYIEDLNRRI